MFPFLRKTLSSHHWQWTSLRNFFVDSSACVGPRRTRTTTRTKCSRATASSTSMPLLQRAAALQHTAIFRILFFLPHQGRQTFGCEVLPGHCVHHHACSQLFVVLGADDVAAVVPQGDVGTLGVQRGRVGGRHRDDAQVPDVPEGSVQVVHCSAERIQVTGRLKRVN